MFKYVLYDVAGDRLGEATYQAHVHPGETIHALGTSRYRVLRVVPVDDLREIARDAAGLDAAALEQLVGLLQVEAL